jgi:hypothetical protein
VSTQEDFCEGRGLSTPPKTDLSLSDSAQVSIFTEVMVLLRRHAVLTVRDPTIYLGRAMVNFMSCLFFAIVYLESRNYVQEQVSVPRVCCLPCHICTPTLVPPFKPLAVTPLVSHMYEALVRVAL